MSIPTKTGELKLSEAIGTSAYLDTPIVNLEIYGQCDTIEWHREPSSGQHFIHLPAEDATLELWLGDDEDVEEFANKLLSMVSDDE